MPQETNLNTAPYFDDFDPQNNYFKVLFKPEYPVQARELTTLQSILQDQVEKFGNHVFKEGDSVTGGGVHYTNNLDCVLVETEFAGISVTNYIDDLNEKILTGSVSGIRAKVKAHLNVSAFPGESYTLYLNYLSSSADGNNDTFIDGETLLVETGFSNSFVTFQDGEAVATTIAQNSTAQGSSAVLDEGVYFIRGYFVEVPKQTIILDPYSNFPSYRIGLETFEELVNSDIDENLNDNAQGYSNYTAAGADRLKIRAYLTKRPLDDGKYENFIELMVVNGGEITAVRKDTQYNEIAKEFARRTYDESGDYYVKEPTLQVKESLNNLKGSRGVFLDTQTTYNGNVPAESLGTYIISPTKAYVRGYEVETVSPTYLDFQKPRTTKLFQNQSINYTTGPTFGLNRVSGSPIVGLSTSYTVSLRDNRIGVAATIAAGKEIGLARVYDFALESGSYNTVNADTNVWDATLFDIQPYTSIELNENITLSTPTHIRGKASGATGFLRYDVTNSGIITAYNTKGRFALGEEYEFDSVQTTRVSTGVTAFSTKDVQSIFGNVGTASTFNADVIQTALTNLGQVNVTGNSGGISTVTNTDLSKFFIGITTVGDLVSYSVPGRTIPTFSKVESVSQHTLTLSGITTVTGVCDGGLPSSNINPGDFTILSSSFQEGLDKTLYTVLPKQKIASVDLTNSSLSIRKQFDVNITANSTGAVSSGSALETFLPFDEERYILIRSDGVTEALSADKFVFGSGGTTLTINGLGTNSSAKLIATLRKIDVKSKIKNRNKVKIITVTNSKYQQSGIGATTLNDGLTYATGYGTRVQDQEICLLLPDVTKIHGIFESSSTSDAVLPKLTLTSLSGPSNKTGDLLVGEEFTSSNSKFVGIYLNSVDDLNINFTPLNGKNLVSGETITFKNSGITALVSLIDDGDNNISSNFTFDNGQRDTIYDYSRIIRKSNVKEPEKRLKIVYEHADFSSSDTGDITTVNSYNEFGYCDLPIINGVCVSDIIDIRPRVSEFTSSTLSPFEFNARTFTADGNSAANVLASDESITLDYSFYLPRIDKVFLSKDGTYQLVKGVAAETPLPPNNIENSLEVATLTLPAYLCNVDSADVSLNSHPRYMMEDIKNLDRRIKNLEFYTSLSIVESDTSNLFIRDVNGLNRFKSGFFVDDFSSTRSQIKKTIVKNSIDVKNAVLRPSHYTDEIDLVLGSNALIGIGTVSDPSVDQAFATDITATNVTKTGSALTLDYQEIPYIRQTFASRTENVTPFLVNYYAGTIELNPASDLWCDTTKLAAKTIEVEGNYTKTLNQLEAEGYDPKSGFSSVIWDSWKTTWTGEKIKKHSDTAWVGNENIRTDFQTVTKTGTKTRTGTRKLTKEVFDDISLGNAIVSTQLVPYLRSRNIEFTSKRMKPFTRVYGFLDGEDVNEYITPKLLEIQMTSGVFEPGETVEGRNTFGIYPICTMPNRLPEGQESTLSGSTNQNNVNPGDTISIAGNISKFASSPTITFRVAQSNHKYGPYDKASTIFVQNPYNKEQVIPESYSSTSSILNIDTFSLSEKNTNDFFGYIQIGMKLVGKTSGAEAEIRNIRLFTDANGTILGTVFVPDPNVTTNPRFESGTKVFRLTSDQNNSQIPGFVTTSAEEKYESRGTLNKSQENILSVRNIRVETQTQQESESVSSENTTTVGTTVVGRFTPPTIASVGPPTVYLDSTPVEPPRSGQETFIPVTSATEDTVAPGSRSINQTVLNSVQAAYVDILGRRPETGGEKYWSETRFPELINQGLNQQQALAQIKRDIQSSPEAVFIGRGVIAQQQAQYQVTQPTSTPGTTLTSRAVSSVDSSGREQNTAANAERALIIASYRKNLGRTPVASEIADWQGHVAKNGGGLNDILFGIANSTEAKQRRCRNGRDPLGQSFFVNEQSGIFVTSVDVFFRTKDETLPVTVQLRPTKLGLPTSEIYPFSEVVVDPENILLSDDATVASRIFFKSPVYLTGGEYHSIVLLSDSNEYTVWISRLGEIDVTTANQDESRQVVVTAQPLLGSLYKSQNGETWNPSQYEDLKFNLNRAVFVPEGTVNFFNPITNIDTDTSRFTIKDAAEISSKRIRVGLGSTLQEPNLTLGNTILQHGSNATGNFVGSAGTATGTLTITNSGIGYTPSSGYLVYSDVATSNVTGNGINATVNLAIENGVALAATVSNGGTGYSVGDVLTVNNVGASSLGRNIRLTVGDITGINQLIIDNVQGDFLVGSAGTMRYINNSGVTTDINASTGANVTIPVAPINVTDGLHLKINQKNHGMHSALNRVQINDVAGDTLPTKLTADYPKSSTSDIIVTDSSNFGTFENVGVGTTNLGYAKIGEEIISYSGVSGNILTGVTRSVDNTVAFGYESGDFIQKYELGSVSLRRINKVHNLADSTLTNSVGLDFYNVKIDMSADGVDRSVGTSFPKLYLNSTKSAGGARIKTTENIQYEIITPIVENITPQGTNIEAQVRTISGTSINGTEISYVDKGFESITLDGENYLDSPRLIASRINETNLLSTLQGNKSFTLALSLTSSNPDLSPVIDLNRVAMILTSNRVNNPVTNYVTDNRTSNLLNDPNAFVYACSPVSLEAPATAIKIFMAANINRFSDVRAFYAIANEETDQLIYQPFPGYSNLLQSGQVIDSSQNDGSPDKFFTKSDVLALVESQVRYTDLEFTIDDLPSFKYFSVKLVGTSTNQAYPPRIKDFRTIALA